MGGLFSNERAFFLYDGMVTNIYPENGSNVAVIQYIQIEFCLTKALIWLCLAVSGHMHLMVD